MGSALSNPGKYYLDALKDSGYYIFHVGEGSKDFDTQHLPRQQTIVSNPQGKPVTTMIRKMNLRSLLDLIGYNFDVLFHVQDWTYFIDHERSPIPYFFYCTEISYTYVPKNVWVALAATDAIKKEILDAFPTIGGVIHHGHSVPVIKAQSIFPKKERKYLVSFAGEIYRLGELYKERQDVVKYIKEHVKDAQLHWLEKPKGINSESGNEARGIESGKGLLNAKQYTELLANSKIGINIPTIGGMNFRELEVPVAGAMLLSRRTIDSDIMGFEDRYNCRQFDTPEEAANIINKEYSEEIAYHGWELIINGRNWWKSNLLNFLYKEKIVNDDKSISLYYEYPENYFPKIEERLNDLKTNLQILDYKNLEAQRVFEVKILSEDKIDNIMATLGFTQWTVEGHTIYHRIKELSVIFQQFAGINIPKKVFENVPRLPTKEEIETFEKLQKAKEEKEKEIQSHPPGYIPNTPPS
jgi:hypothetical protein